VGECERGRYALLAIQCVQGLYIYRIIYSYRAKVDERGNRSGFKTQPQEGEAR